MAKRGRKRVLPNISQRPVVSPASASRPSTLPSQYNFTPAANVPPPQSSQQRAPVLPQHSTSAANVRNYPPPQSMFQNSQGQTHPPQNIEIFQGQHPPSRAENSQGRRLSAQREDSFEVQNNPRLTPQQFQNSQSQRQTLQREDSDEFQNNPPLSPLYEAPPSPIHNSQGHSHPPSSQGNNFQDDNEPRLPDLQEDTLRALNALLQVPARDQFTTVLSPTPRPNTACSM